MATKIEGITMGMRELDRVKTVQAVVDGNLKPGLAARRLGITARQLRRVVRRYRAALVTPSADSSPPGFLTPYFFICDGVIPSKSLSKEALDGNTPAALLRPI